MSRSSSVNTTTSISQVRIWENSNLQKIGEMLCGIDIICTKPVSVRASCVTGAPVAGSMTTRPMNVETMIPMSTPPFTRSMTRAAVTIRPSIATRAVPWEILPSATRVESESTMMPAFWQPRKAMNRPIPAPMAFFSVPGMAVISQVRTFVTVRMTKIMPSRSTAVRANCQE